MNTQNKHIRRPFRFGQTRLVKESPDYVEKADVHWSDSDAYPFIIDKDITKIQMSDESGVAHDEMLDAYTMEEREKMWAARKEEWHGRLWRKHNVMSFWRTPKPEQMAKIVELFNKQDPATDYSEYYLEKADERLVKIKDYINPTEEVPDIKKFKEICDRMGVDMNELFREVDAISKAQAKNGEKEEGDAGRFDLSTLHTLNGALKSATPQMKAYLQAKIQNIANKLGTPRNSREVSQAEYNHYRRYGMGESVIKESPDEISYNGLNLDIDMLDARPFIVAPDCKRAWIGLEGDLIHDDITFDDQDPENTNNPDSEDYGESNIVVWVFDRNNSYHGRFWYRRKVLSLWDNPIDAIKVKGIVNALMKCPTYDNQYGDLTEYRLDLGKNVPMPLVKDYINGNVDDKDEIEQFDKATQHVKTNVDRRKDAEMDTYLRDRDSRQSERLGNMSQAEYNHLRRYGMGEGVERMTEMKDSQISLASFQVKKELHPKFWVNDKLNSRVRLRLLDIADDFIKELAVDWVKPSDIVVTGSIANYNWSKYSDIDVHVLIDFSKVWNKRKDFVEDYFKSKKEQWSAAHPKLSIYGFPVEVYVEDTAADNPSTGIYSLEKNKWVREPADFQDSKLNADYIKKKAAWFMNEIDRICAAISKTKDNHRYEKLGNEMYALFNKLKKLRSEGLKKGGEMSSGNIIWKVCRRMGYIEKMWDVVNKAYDRINSIRESAPTDGNLLFEGIYDSDSRGWVNIGIIKGYCPYASGKYTDSYLMADPNAEQTEDRDRFRTRHMTFSPVPEGSERSYSVPNYYLQRLEIYPEYQDTYWGECVLGKKSSKEKMEADYFDFAMKLWREGGDVILQHYSPTKIQGGFVTSGPKRSYSRNSDIGTYFWGSPMAGSDPSNTNQYIYYCRVPLKDIYDFEHNPERLTLTQALQKHPYAGQYWRNSDAVCVNTFRKTPIWFVKDKMTGKCYDANWEQIRDPFG